MGVSLLSLATSGRASSTQAPSSPTKATSAGTVMVSGGPSSRSMRRCMSILSGRASVSGRPGAVGTPDTGSGASRSTSMACVTPVSVTSMLSSVTRASASYQP